MTNEISPESIIATHLGVESITTAEAKAWKAMGEAWLETASDASYAHPNAVLMMAALSIQDVA